MTEEIVELVQKIAFYSVTATCDCYSCNQLRKYMTKAGGSE
jgi:hypothetical protein